MCSPRPTGPRESWEPSWDEFWKPRLDASFGAPPVTETRVNHVPDGTTGDEVLEMCRGCVKE
jgi:hypothetical protein